MRYKILLSSSKQSVPLDSEQDLEAYLGASGKGGLVITKHGIVNPSFVVAVLLDWERMQAERELGNVGFQESEEPSAFAFLVEKKKMLS